jgi:ribosome-associated translation inhibitor RaiA
MQTAVQIVYHGEAVSDHTRTIVATHVAALEERFGRITSCRIAVRAPSDHHRTGGKYEVGIHLALPGKHDVNVDHSASADERFADIAFAINDAFKRARRQLQDQVRRMRGEVKAHGAPPH